MAKRRKNKGRGGSAHDRAVARASQAGSPDMPPPPPPSVAVLGAAPDDHPARKSDWGLFFGVLSVVGMLVIFVLQSNGVEMNWVVSACMYAVAALGLVASVVLHAIPHWDPLKRRAIGGLAFLCIVGIGSYGTLKEYRREHPAAKVAQPGPSVVLSGYIVSPNPYADGSRFAGITWHPNDVDVRLDVANGATDIQNLDLHFSDGHRNRGNWPDKHVSGGHHISNCQHATVVGHRCR